jgi:SpoU rRNA methylase family enzyme
MNSGGTPNPPDGGGDYQTLLAALEQLRLNLLDLTGRNRLLNFRHSAGRSLQFVEGSPAAIYEKLVEANARGSITISGLPEPSRRDWVERNGRLFRPDPAQWAAQQGIPTSFELRENTDNGVRALLYLDDLAKHCRKIEREAVLAIEETGANMLFLVLGFLDYPDQRDSDRIFSAPLISIPVSLSKREAGGHQVFSLQYTGDDISENLSLREKLRTDNALILPEIPEEQMDVEEYFSAINRIIRDRPGFVLRRRISLCLLSFTNMLLVRDLDPDKWPTIGGKHRLLDHPLVREIFEGKQQSEDTDADWGVAPEHDVETGIGADVPLVFDADSSQHSALIDVLAQRKNVVIEGPPGTGKSQTITNLIAAAIASGRKVLFVAEKMAALDVVKARLTRAGLDPFILELHSNKTNKKRVLEELAKRAQHRPSPPSDLPRKLQELEAHRRDLREYRDLINSVSFNAFGSTLHQIMWRCERYRMALSGDHRSLTRLSIADAREISELELVRRMDCLGHLGDQYAAIGGFGPDSPFWGFFPEPIVPGDEIRLQEIFRNAAAWTSRFVQSVAYYDACLGARTFGLGLDDAASQLRVLQQLGDRADRTLPLSLIPRLFRDDKTGRRAGRSLEAFAAKVARYHELASSLASAIRVEEAVTEDQLGGLRELEECATKWGAELGTPAELSTLGGRLHAEKERLDLALTAINEFCAQNGIPFDGSRSRLQGLRDFAAAVAEAPEELLHLQTPGLARDGSHTAIEALCRLQHEWMELAAELDEIVYLDVLPGEDVLKQAILTFREGETWYRSFQGRWRAAVATHRSLQRAKRRVQARERLAELERVIAFLQLKERWRNDPAWTQYIGMIVPTEPIPLEGHLTLATWNRSVKVLLQELGAPVFSLAELTPKRARALRFTFATFGTQVAIALSAQQVLDALLPKLVESPAGAFARNFVDAADVMIQAIAAQLPWLEVSAHAGATLANVHHACEAAFERRRILKAITTDVECKVLLEDQFRGIDTNIEAALAALAFGQELERHQLPDQVIAKLKSTHPLEAAEEVAAVLARILEGLQQVRTLGDELASFGAFELDTWAGISAEGDLGRFVASLQERLEACVDHVDSLVPWSLYLARRREAEELGLEAFAELLESRNVSHTARSCERRSVLLRNWGGFLASSITRCEGNSSGWIGKSSRRAVERSPRRCIRTHACLVAGMAPGWMIARKWSS